MKKPVCRVPLFALCLLTVLLCVSAALGEGRLLISEVITSNSAYKDADGETCDMIELVNAGDADVNLSEYCLSDKKSKPEKYRLPDKTLRPGAYYTVSCTGEGDRKHAGFKLSADGETVYLSRDGADDFTDVLKVPALPHNVSYGREGDRLCYFVEATFGKANAGGVSRICGEALCDVPGGLYDAPVTVTLLSPDPDAAIRYTLDGSDPAEKGMPYEGPVTVSENACLRFCLTAPDALPGKVLTRHYLMNCEQYTLPIVSLSTQPGTVTGKSGLWEKYERRSMEAAVNLCFIENGTEVFSIDCGLTLHGQGSRALKKKSFNVKFKSRYGADCLTVPLFGEESAAYTSLVLRGGSEDFNRAMVRDEFLTALTAKYMPDVLTQAYRPANLFIDGEYYGIYYIRERIDEQYVAAHLGGSEEDVDIVNGWRINQAGDIADWQKLMSDCRKKDLRKDDPYQSVLDRICADGFIDYYIMRAYSGDRDYPNIRHVRSRGGDGLWRIVNFDLDWAFGSDPAGFSEMLSKTHDTNALNTVIITALCKNPDFRARFLTRLGEHLRTTFRPENVLSVLEEVVDAITPDMPLDRARWNQSMDKWQSSVQFLRDFADTRAAELAREATRVFRMTDEEIALYFDGVEIAQKK